MSAVGGLKKAWRDSAGLMLLTGPFRYNGWHSGAKLASVGSFLGFGSVPPICLEEKEEKKERKNMELLFVQRNKITEFMPNTYVFPGGVLDKADYSPTWYELYHESSGPDQQPFAGLLAQRKHGHFRLPLYSDIPNNSPIAGEVAFRICAIREVFEEAGVLLARDNEDVASKMDLLPGTFSPAVKVLPEGISEKWRKRVHSNAEEFATMCRELHCVPDIWSLIEWSDWLTPRNMGRRYDTVFYLCCCETTPPISADGTEVVDARWMSPTGAVERFMSKEITLALPQFTELANILRFDTVSCLHSYALHGSLNGQTYRKVGIRIKTKDLVILNFDSDVCIHFCGFHLVSCPDHNEKPRLVNGVKFLELVHAFTPTKQHPSHLLKNVWIPSREAKFDFIHQTVSYQDAHDLLNGDDLYPAEATYWMTTDQSPAIHQPHCPALRDRVPLHVRYHKGYEYECPTHTAEELHQLTTRACRLEIRSPRDFKFFDNIITKKVDDHMERYAAARKSLKSRL